MAVKSYRDLIAWQKAMDLACASYRLTAHFPGEERYGLCSQSRAAAVSVPSKIAEGQARSSKEFRRFLGVSRGSLQELETQLLLAERLGFVELTKLQPVLTLADEVGRVIRGLSASLSSRQRDGLSTSH